MPWICNELECKKQPYYAAPGVKKPQYCFLHKKIGHVDVRNKRCEVDNCEIRPHYGYDGEAPRFCAQHRAEGMHNLRSRRCQSEGCVRYASCGHAGNPPMFCGAHKTMGMVNLIGRRCAVEQCETYASYGVNGEKARYCAKHKGVNMVNLTVKHCEYTECVTQPSFNYQGQRKARFCARHRLEHMVDVLDRHCAQQGCDRQPIYGQPGEREGRPTYCPDHRLQGSFDVKTSRCQEPGCLKHPSYGYDNDRIRRRCRLHKLDNMVDVKSPRCEMIGCRKQPCCGFPGLKPRYCSEHKQNGMLNLKTRAFRCKYRGPQVGEHVTPEEAALLRLPGGKTAPCNRACRYAYPGEEAVYCVKHKINGMVDVVNPSCKMQDCLEEPTHGYDGEAATFCEAHMAVGMKPIAVVRPAALHWSAELRRQAKVQARERSKVDNEVEVGSAKCMPLPPKAATLEEKQRRLDIAAHAVMEAQAAQARSAEAAAAAASMALNTREMLSASTAPIVPPFSHEDMGPSSITSAELTLAFSGLPDEDLAAAAAAASGNLSLPSHAPASGSFMGYVMGTGSSSGAHGGGFAVPAPQQPSGLPGIVGAESGPAKKRRRAGEGMPGTAVGPGMMSTSQGQFPTSTLAASTAAAAAAAAAVAAANPPSPAFTDSTYHTYSNELMAPLSTGPAAATPATSIAPHHSNHLLPMHMVTTSYPPPPATSIYTSAAAAAPVAATSSSTTAPPSYHPLLPSLEEEAQHAAAAAETEATSLEPVSAATMPLPGSAPPPSMSDAEAAMVAVGLPTSLTSSSEPAPMILAQTATDPARMAAAAPVDLLSLAPVAPAAAAAAGAGLSAGMVGGLDGMGGIGAGMAVDGVSFGGVVGMAAAALAVGSKCAVADCVAPATFGHPGPGHIPTHCLTHCEEGMHRLAAEIRPVAPVVAPPLDSETGKRKAEEMDGGGMDLTTDPVAATAVAAAAVTTAPGTGEIAAMPTVVAVQPKAKRARKATAQAGEGIMLLAGAVASQEEEDDTEEEYGDAQETTDTSPEATMSTAMPDASTPLAAMDVAVAVATTSADAADVVAAAPAAPAVAPVVSVV